MINFKEFSENELYQINQNIVIASDVFWELNSSLIDYKLSNGKSYPVNNDFTKTNFKRLWSDIVNQQFFLNTTNFEINYKEFFGRKIPTYSNTKCIFNIKRTISSIKLPDAENLPMYIKENTLKYNRDKIVQLSLFNPEDSNPDKTYYCVIYGGLEKLDFVNIFLTDYTCDYCIEKLDLLNRKPLFENIETAGNFKRSKAKLKQIVRNSINNSEKLDGN